MTDESERERKFIPEEGPLAILWRHERALRWALPLLALFVAGVLGVLPRVWTVAKSPEGRPLRISGLDWIQGRSLAGAAKRLEAEKRYVEALAGWEGASARNPGDPAFARGVVRCLDQLPDLARSRLPGAADWLLHLCATNQETLQWVAPVLARHKHWSWLGARLTTEVVGTVDELGAVRSRAQYEAGKIAEFDSELAAHPGRLKANAELALIAAARRAITAHGRLEATPHQQELERAATVPATRRLALHLLLELAYSQRDLWHYERLLAAGGPETASSLQIQMRYWRLLDRFGQRERAVRLTRESGIVPADMREAEALLTLLAEFGLKDSVALIGQQALAKWGYSPQPWVVMGDVLITLADWEGLRDHAVRLRQIVAFREELGGYSWFLDGLAEQQLGHPERAEAAWKTFCDNLPRNEGVALRAAATFSRRDLPRQTFEVLVRLHGRGEPPDAVLVNLQAAAHKLRNLEWFERTSRELFARHPKDQLVMNNFAAALMIQGDRSAEVLPLTLQQLQAMPNAGGAIVNHAFALIQAGRPSEAAPLLARVESMSLGPEAEEMFRYARVRYHSALGQLAEAKQHAQKLSLDDLYPNQRQQIADLIQPLTAGEP